jgi:hypothetical protein
MESSGNRVLFLYSLKSGPRRGRVTATVRSGRHAFASGRSLCLARALRVSDEWTCFAHRAVSTSIEANA